MNAKIKSLSLAVLFIAVFTSCNNNESDEPVYHVFATIENPDSTRNYLLVADDDGSRMKPTNASKILRDGQRVYARFHIVEEKSKEDDYQYGIEYTYLYQILTKDIFNFTTDTSQEIKDSIGNDPVIIRNMWVSNDFLNIDFIFMAKNSGIKHYINLVADESKVYEDDKVHLEFKHNANDDSPQLESGGIASFYLVPLRENAVGDSVSVVIHWRGYDSENEKKHEVTYKFNSEEANPEPQTISIEDSGFIIE